MSLLELEKMSTKGHNVFSVSGFILWNLLHLSQSAFPFALSSIPKTKNKKQKRLFSQVYSALECLKSKRVPHLLICLFIRPLLFDHQVCNRRRERAGDPKWTSVGPVASRGWFTGEGCRRCSDRHKHRGSKHCKDKEPLWKNLFQKLSTLQGEVLWRVLWKEAILE